MCISNNLLFYETNIPIFITKSANVTYSLMLIFYSVLQGVWNKQSFVVVKVSSHPIPSQFISYKHDISALKFTQYIEARETGYIVIMSSSDGKFYISGIVINPKFSQLSPGATDWAGQILVVTLLFCMIVHLVMTIVSTCADSMEFYICKEV